MEGEATWGVNLICSRSAFVRCSWPKIRARSRTIRAQTGVVCGFKSITFSSAAPPLRPFSQNPYQTWTHIAFSESSSRDVSAMVGMGIKVPCTNNCDVQIFKLSSTMALTGRPSREMVPSPCRLLYHWHDENAVRLPYQCIIYHPRIERRRFEPLASREEEHRATKVQSAKRGQDPTE